MDRPLEIAFHGLDSSPSLEAGIRGHVEKLAARYPQLVGCRVSIEALHNQHRTGNVYDVHLVLSLRGRDLVVAREPDRAKGRYATPDLRTSVRDAFKAAERLLQAHKEQLREDTTPPSAHAMSGVVAQLAPDADHGFILSATGSQLYFHRDSVTNAAFADLRQGDVVHYVEEEGSSGPVANKVRLGA
ncbi:MAG: HPF/RaiA family ribosome-associated protein [Acetobacteraceae bacterium]|nr:HPF/RaiA family ribosome-associated protein [Acetobacteraceae bacterium]